MNPLITILLTFTILITSRCFKIVNSDANDDDSLVLAFQLTRHGARSPYLKISQSITSEWNQGLGQLTPTGERQHFLLGTKHRKELDQYKLLSETFNPKEVYIVATDVNRTIMSAYSELNAWYPMGKVKNLGPGEKNQALPPFEVKGKDTILNQLGDSPTMFGFQPVPIHVSQQIDELLRSMDAPVCPNVAKYEARAMQEEEFKKVNEKYKDNFLKPLKENWGINDELNFFTAKGYSDTYYAAMFNKSAIDAKYKLDESMLNELIADQFYYVTFFYDEMIRLATTKAFNYLYTLFDSKIESIKTGKDDGTGIKDRKLIYFSAHDSTVAAFMSGIEQKQKLQPYYAIPILIQLWKKAGTDGKDPANYYVKWLYNGKTVNLNGTCEGTSDFKCAYPNFKSFLQYREYKGDWYSGCFLDIESSYMGKWYIVVGIAAGVLVLGGIGYFVIKKVFLAPNDK